MGTTLVEKILKAATGEVVRVKPDICMINDGVGHNCLELINKSKTIADKNPVFIILDHDIPAGSFDSAANQKKLIDFSRENGLKFIQSAGIGYQVLLDSHVKPGDVLVSCGKHNSFVGAAGALGLKLSIEEMAELITDGSFEMKVPKTIRIELKGSLSEGVSAIDLILTILANLGESELGGLAVEFTGTAAQALSLNDKIVICSMISQSGAVSALMNPEPAVNYFTTLEYDLAKISPTVTLPGNLYRTKSLKELKGVAISAAFVGGCMGSRIEDLRVAAEILKGKRIKLGVRLMLGFASNAVYFQAAEEGLIDIFIDSGAMVTNPGCASCQTTSIGVVGDGEVLLTTGSHNYPGCSGTTDSTVYIASAATVTRAALTGYIYE